MIWPRYSGAQVHGARHNVPHTPRGRVRERPPSDHGGDTCYRPKGLRTSWSNPINQYGSYKGLRCIVVFPVLPQQTSDPVEQGHDDSSDNWRYLQHCVFRSISRQKKRGVHEARPPVAFSLCRCKKAGQKEFDVAGRGAPARDMQVGRSCVPPTVRRTGRPNDELTGIGKTLFLTKHLVPEASGDDSSGFLLEIVDVHRWPGTRLGDSLNLNAIAIWSVRHAKERQLFPVPVFDRVWIVYHTVWFFLGNNDSRNLR